MLFSYKKSELLIHAIIYNDRKQISSYLGLGLDYKGVGVRKFGRMKQMFVPDWSDDGFMSIPIKSDQIAHLKYVQFIIPRLYHNKVKPKKLVLCTL